jgi:UDP-glucose 4-epimerase
LIVSLGVGARVVVTGAGGLLGEPTVRRLLTSGWDVVAHIGPPGTPGEYLPVDVPTAHAEITDLPAVTRLLTDAAAVVHFAGPPSVAQSFAAPAEFARVHTQGTATLLQACRTVGVQRLVYISSAEVYGQPSSNPVSEDAPLQPLSPYGAVKVGAELLIRALAAETGLDCVILRPFSVYGPRSPATSVVGRLARALADQQIAIRLATLRPVRDYLHVTDVASAVDRALSLAAGPCPLVCNIGSGVGTSVRELAELARSLSGRSAVIEEAPDNDRPATANVRELIADISRARRELQWVPCVSLDQGLTDVLAAISRRD